jgi:hypothetical protein
MYVSRTFDPQFSESGGFPMAAHHRACSTGSVHACMLRTTPSKQLGATDNHVRASTRSRNGAGVDRHLHECNRRFGPATTCPRHNLQATRLPHQFCTRAHESKTHNETTRQHGGGRHHRERNCVVATSSFLESR